MGSDRSVCRGEHILGRALDPSLLRLSLPQSRFCRGMREIETVDFSRKKRSEALVRSLGGAAAAAARIIWALWAAEERQATVGPLALRRSVGRTSLNRER